MDSTQSSEHEEKLLKERRRGCALVLPPLSPKAGGRSIMFDRNGDEFGRAILSPEYKGPYGLVRDGKVIVPSRIASDKEMSEVLEQLSR